MTKVLNGEKVEEDDLKNLEWKNKQLFINFSLKIQSKTKTKRKSQTPIMKRRKEELLKMALKSFFKYLGKKRNFSGN